jgi:hypothetical protein
MGEYSRLRVSRKIFMAVIALTGWFALGLQAWLLLQKTAAESGTAWRALGNYFSYFTILTNLLATLSVTLPLLFPSRSLAAWLDHPKIRTAITLYILVVGLVYLLVLRQLWDPRGWNKVADSLLHDFMPLFYLLFWMVFVPKDTLHWRNSFSWLLFPLLFLIYSLVRGRLTGWYPYPFIDAARLGAGQLLANTLLLMGVFLFLGILLAGLGRLMARSSGVRQG